MFKLLTFEWFIFKAILGLVIGFAFRSFEHWAWERSENDVRTFKSFIFLTATFLAQSACIGIPLAYLILIFIAKNVEDETVLTVSAYLLPTLVSFLAVDLRDLLRRIYKIN
jgi:hypothetical protein